MAGIGGKINNLTTADPYSFVAGPDPLQTQAAQGAAGLSGSPNFNEASGIMSGVASAGPNLSGGPASLLDGLEGYMSPYRHDVVDSALADYDYGAGQTLAQNKLSLAGDTTFGGSGGAIQTALSNDALTRGRGTLSAGLNDAAFQTGANLSNLDAGRRQQSSQFDAQQRDADLQRRLAAGQGLSDIGTAQGNDTRSNIAVQSTIGQMLQQLSQQRTAAPLNLLQLQAGLYGSLPLGLTHGQTTDGTDHTTSTTTSSDPMKAIGSLAMAAGALGFAPLTGGASLAGLGSFLGAPAAGAAGTGLLASDRRLKTDIKRVGELDDGLGVFRYRYKSGGPMHIGVMAQEVAKTKPHAVHDIGGLLAVDYGQL